MGILSSMYTGFSGIQGQGEALSVFGDNISNSNTIGFKTSRPEFQDVVAKSLKGLLGGNQIGRGTKLAAVRPILAQGTLLQTENASDLAITGNGYFVLDGADGRSFTRDGSFRFDKEGALINSDGNRVVGFQAEESGKITSKMGPIKIDRSVIDAKATQKVELFANLDSRADAKRIFDPEKAESTAHFASGVTVYDSNGTAHAVTVYFNKTDNGKWSWKAAAKGEEIVGGAPGKEVIQAEGELTFDSEGRMQEQKTNKSAFNFTNGGKPDQEVQFQFGTDKATGGDGLQVTQYGSDSEAYKTIQNGYKAGTLSNLTFGDDGKLSAIYSNGEMIAVAQVALAKFENPEDMLKLGGNRFKESRMSGQPTVGAPGAGGRGTMSAKTIEASTTDIANEFINLMTAQRNFQANSRVISTADEMMQEVINLKRS